MGLVKYLTSLQRFAALLLKVALDEVFDFAEDHFHHHRLRAGPTTPETAKGGGENQNSREEDEHCDGEDDAVLRLEDLAENGKAALDDIAMLVFFAGIMIFTTAFAPLRHETGARTSNRMVAAFAARLR